VVNRWLFELSIALFKGRLEHFQIAGNDLEALALAAIYLIGAIELFVWVVLAGAKAN